MGNEHTSRTVRGSSLVSSPFGSHATRRRSTESRREGFPHQISNFPWSYTPLMDTLAVTQPITLVISI